MDVMSLAAQITLNSKQFESALGSAEGSIASLAKSVVGTQAVIKGLEMGFDALNKVVRGGVDAYANYEQLVGGVDTLFKGSSMKLQEYAWQAFETAGLSANEYMETVTSFSASLIQGLKGDTEKAADVADMAIIDMADNANKMGTDMQSIQNAYMGFAKGNFSMLDNLKLGYGGTKTEMVRLINDSGVLDKKIKNIDEVSFDQMIQAIHKVQEELGITGTTAEEAATTIEGSRKSLYSAFQNLLTLATDGTDQNSIQAAQDAFISSFSKYFNDNLQPRIVEGLKGSSSVFLAIASALLTVPSGSLGELVDAGMEGATGLVTGLTQVTGWLLDELEGVFSNPQITEEDSTKFGEAIGDFVGTFVREGVAHLPNIISGIFALGLNVAQGFIQGLTAGLFGVGADTVTGDIEAIDDAMAKSIEDANVQAAKANSLITWLDDLQTKYGEAAADMPEWQQAMQGLIGISDDYLYFFDRETNQLTTSTDAMRDHTKAIKEMQIEEAKNRVLGEKQQLVTNLQAERAERQGTAEYARVMQGGIANEYAGWLNGIFASNGVAGTNISLGMTVEELNETIRRFNEANGTHLMESGVEYSGTTVKNAKGEDVITYDTIVKIAEYMQNFGLTTEEQDQKVAGLSEEYEKQTETIRQAEADIEAINGSLVIAENSLRVAQNAVDLWASSLQQSAVENWNGRPGDKNRVMKHATGLDRVPYDGYMAQLHRDEAVLTRAEAEDWRSGGNVNIDYTQMANVVASAIMEGMSNVGFYFDKERVAAAVTPAVSQNIADGMAAWGYS